MQRWGTPGQGSRKDPSFGSLGFGIRAREPYGNRIGISIALFTPPYRNKPLLPCISVFQERAVRNMTKKHSHLNLCSFFFFPPSHKHSFAWSLRLTKTTKPYFAKTTTFSLIWGQNWQVLPVFLLQPSIFSGSLREHLSYAEKFTDLAQGGDLLLNLPDFRFDLRLFHTAMLSSTDRPCSACCEAFIEL